MAGEKKGGLDSRLLKAFLNTSSVLDGLGEEEAKAYERLSTEIGIDEVNSTASNWENADKFSKLLTKSQQLKEIKNAQKKDIN